MSDSNEQLQSRIAELEAEVAGLKSHSGGMHAAWAKLQAAYPNELGNQESPNADALPRVVDAFTEMVMYAERIDQQVGKFLSELKGHYEPFDTLSDLFRQNPRASDATRDFVLTGRRRGAFLNALRARFVLLSACASGMYKAIVDSHLKMQDDLNYRNWKDLKGASSDAAIGKYVRERLQELADKLNTDLRKQAAQRIEEDYAAMP
ncbi:MAG: hypothetical protein ACKVS9_10930 [Phycisphaerae bacterium]